MPPSSAASQTDLVRVLSAVAAVSAGVMVDPDIVVSRVLSQAASVASYINAEPSSPASSPAFLSSALNSAASYVDRTAYTLRWRQQIAEFDAQSPVDHRVLVRVATALVVLATTRVLCRALLK